MKHSLSLRYFFYLTTYLCIGLAYAEPTTGAEEKKKPTTGKKPIVKVKHTTLYKNSHIITHRGEHAIIPKRSILFIPENLKSRVVEKPSGKFVLWPFFKLRNQEWIWTYEVTLDQAKGKSPIPAGKIKQFEKLNRMVVALYRGNPVSIVAPPKKESANKKSGKEEDKNN
ncbi:MAG: hypothetical protein AB8F34_06710 [Akkermansiaceae bacterium]